MNHGTCRILAFAALAGLPLMTQAADALVDPPDTSRHGWVLAAGAGSLELRETAGINDVADYAWLQGGWRFNRFLSLDARLGTGIKSTGFELNFGQPVNLRIKSLYGLYARALLPIAQNWELFALVGYTSLKFSADTGVAAASETTNSVSYGLGASWNFGARAAIDMEYLPSVTSGDGWHSDSMSVGIRMQF